MTLPHGPRDPATATPPRQPRSIRRTSHIDLRRRDARGGTLSFTARARDLVTRSDSTAVQIGAIEIVGALDRSGGLESIRVEPDEPAVAELVGARVGRGFRARVDEALPAHLDARSLLRLVLDDLPVVTMVSGYGDMRDNPAVEMPPGSTERMIDVCAGWQAGETMMAAFDATGYLPMPDGPAAPDLAAADDPLAWHDVAVPEPGVIRRRRRLDIVLDDPLRVDAMFRDSHRRWTGDEETALHEYWLEATIDPTTGAVMSISASPKVLPWPECPRAAASAARTVGQKVDTLSALVSEQFTGVSTCTHLNDLLRSLGDVPALSRPAR